MKRIVITGSGSFVGTAFESWLGQYDGYEVDTVDMIGDDWKNKDFGMYDSVFHVAGIAHSDTGNATEEEKKKYYEINTDLAIETAKKAKSDGAKQFIYMSSAIVYGESACIGRDRIITEKTPVSPANFYGDSKVQAEIGLKAVEGDGFNVVILRPPMIYGKGGKGNYHLLSKMARLSPVFPYVKNQRSMLYIDNLCEFVKLMIDNEERGTFWPQNSEYTNTSEMVGMIAEAQGKRILLIKGFSWALKLLSNFSSKVNKAFGNMCYDKSMSEYKTEYRKFDLKQSIMRTEE